MNFPVLAILFLITVTSCQFLERIKPNGLSCKPCEGPECEMTFESCKFGKVRNYCGQLECKRSLNQTCGGRFEIKGVCADGLQCVCGVCTGCMDGECFTITSSYNCPLEDFDFNRLLMKFGKNPYASLP